MVSRLSVGLLILGFVAAGTKMDCNGASLCGILTLESGLASTPPYKHKSPTVHGLWPQVPPFGNSQCIAPTSKSPPTKVYKCYDTGEGTDQLTFEQHEWGKHGVCAAGQGADWFFNNMCTLAAEPIAIIGKAAKDLNAMKTALTQAGIEVFDVDTKFAQLELSVCYSPKDDAWVLSPQAHFNQNCGGGAGPPTPPTPPGPGPPTPPTPGPSGSCSPHIHGPACVYDYDCTQFTGCVRCASSGFCTDQTVNTKLSLKSSLNETKSWTNRTYNATETH